MKSRTLTFISAITLFAALAIPVRLAAQHTRYKLIEIGTFGGPASYLGDPGVGPGVLHLNNRGVLIGHADTAFSDPNAPDNCDNPDCRLLPEPRLSLGRWCSHRSRYTSGWKPQPSHLDQCTRLDRWWLHNWRIRSADWLASVPYCPLDRH